MTNTDTDLPTPTLRRRSVSQLLSYSNCSEAFRLERRTDAPQRPAGWFFHGTAVHDAIEAWENSGRTMTEEELNLLYLTTYRTLVNEAIEEHNDDLSVFMTGGWKKVEDDLSDREDTGWYQVQEWIQEALKARDIWEPVAVEPEFNILLGGVWLNGFIDLIVRNKVTGQLAGLDYKTGAKVPSSPTQLAVYRHAITLMYPGEQVSDTFYWIHLGRPASKTGKTRAKPTKWVAEDLSDWTPERLAAWLQQMDEAERQGIYLPSPGDGCRVCSVQQWCRAKGWHMPSIQQYAPEGMFDPVELTIRPEEEA